MKKIILSLTLLMGSLVGFSQNFMNGIGVHILGTSAPGSSESGAFGVGVTYSPRFNVMSGENMSVSVGIPITLGFTSTTYTTSYGGVVGANGEEDKVSIGLVFNAPLIVNLNMGRGATKENENSTKFGYFVGAGFGYHHGDFIGGGGYDQNGNYIDEDTYSVNSFGPAANAGVRLGMGRRHNLELKLTYMKGITNNFHNIKPNFYGLACIFNF